MKEPRRDPARDGWKNKWTEQAAATTRAQDQKIQSNFRFVEQQGEVGPGAGGWGSGLEQQLFKVERKWCEG